MDFNAAKNINKLALVPFKALCDHQHSAADLQSIEPLLDKMLGNAEIGVVRRIAQNNVKFRLVDFRESIAFNNPHIGYIIETSVFLGKRYGARIHITHENLFLLGKMSAKNPNNAVSTAQIENFGFIRNLTFGEHGKRPLVNFLRGKTPVVGFERQGNTED